MSSAHRSRYQQREDAQAATVRTPADEARALAEGRRQQAEIIAEAEADGSISPEQAAEYRARFGLSPSEREMKNETPLRWFIGYRIENLAGRWVASGATAVSADNETEARATAEKIIWASFRGNKRGKTLLLTVTDRG